MARSSSTIGLDLCTPTLNEEAVPATIHQRGFLLRWGVLAPALSGKVPS